MSYYKNVKNQNRGFQRELTRDSGLLTWGGWNWQSFSTLLSLIATILLGGVFSTNLLIVAIVGAAAGGLVQEIFQTGGSVAYPQWKHDGLYFGSVSGLILGALSGLLTLTILPVGSIVDVAFVSEMFFAGMALKGVAEAAGGHAGKSPPDH